MFKLVEGIICKSQYDERSCFLAGLYECREIRTLISVNSITGIRPMCRNRLANRQTIVVAYSSVALGCRGSPAYDVRHYILHTLHNTKNKYTTNWKGILSHIRLTSSILHVRSSISFGDMDD